MGLYGLHRFFCDLGFGVFGTGYLYETLPFLLIKQHFK